MKFSLVVCAMVMGGLVVLPASANLLVNGDFDAGPAGQIPTGWFGYNDSWSGGVGTREANSGNFIHNPSPTEFGTYSLRVGEWNDGGSGGVAQYVTGLELGQEYTLTAKFAWGNNGQQYAWHELGIMPGMDSNPNDGTPIVLFKKTEANGSSSWVDVTLNFTAATEEVTVFVKAGSNTGQPFATWVDNADLTPEPASLMLLLLGMPMLRRRR